MAFPRSSLTTASVLTLSLATVLTGSVARAQAAASTPLIEVPVDLRAYQSPVKDQGSRGTCTAFAVAAALENFPGVPLDASEQFLYALAKDNQATRATLFAAYYRRRSELKVLFSDGMSLKEYVETLPMYGVCEERFFPYRPARVTVTKALDAALPKADREKLARQVYSRTQFTQAVREKMRLLGKFDVTDVELVDFTLDHLDMGLTPQQRSTRIRAKSRRLVDWLRDGKIGHQAIPVAYVISKKAWSAYMKKPDVPVFTARELPKTAEDAGGHAVTLVGWTPSLRGYVKNADPGDRSGYYIIKNSWGTKWGGLGGFGLVRSDVHFATIKQALLIGGVKRRISSAVYSPFDRVRIAKGLWRLKVQVLKDRRTDQETLVLSTYASNLKEPNLPAVRYVLRMEKDKKRKRLVSPLIRRTAEPGFVWRVPFEKGVYSLDVTLVHHRVIIREPEPTSGLRFKAWMLTSIGRAIDVRPVAGGALDREQAKAALSGH